MFLEKEEKENMEEEQRGLPVLVRGRREKVSVGKITGFKVFICWLSF